MSHIFETKRNVWPTYRVAVRWRLQSLFPASMSGVMRIHLFRARESKRKGLTRKTRFLRLNVVLLVVCAGAFRSSHQKSRSRPLYYSSPRRKDRPAQDSIDGDTGNRVHVRGSEYSTRSSHQQERPSQSPRLTNAKKQLDGENRDSPGTTRHSTQQTYVGSK